MWNSDCAVTLAIGQDQGAVGVLFWKFAEHSPLSLTDPLTTENGDYEDE